MADFSLSLKKLAGMIDQECVYKERGLIMHVQLKGVCILDESIQIVLKPIKTIGFGTRNSQKLKIECALELIRFGSNRLFFSYVGSELFTGKDDVKKIVNFAKSMPDLESFLTIIDEVRRKS